MKILSIGTDRKIFEKDSPARARMLEYGTLFDELHIIVFAKKALALKPEQLSSSVWVYPTNSFSKINYIRDAVIIGEKIGQERQFKKGEAIVTCQDPFETGLVGWLLKKSLKLPLQVQVHVDFFSPYFKSESWHQRIQALIGPFFLRRADVIRVVSHRIKDYLIKNLSIDDKKITVLPIQTSVERFRNAPVSINLRTKYPRFSDILLIASRLVKVKNITLAICALSILKKKYPNIGLVVVGSGSEERSLKADAKFFGVEDSVVFESWADDLASYYKTADIFLLPSNYEGWGLTVVEACACGLPVVMTDVGCAGEFIKNGENGLVVPAANSKAFVLAINSLLQNQELRNQISKNGIKSVESIMDRKTYLDLYRKSFTL